MPKVSVIIPVYNVERYLGECLDSILGQTLKDIEVVCVDDGSTDGSAKILDDYAAKDPRARVIHQANAGAGPARNAGLAAATGDYVAFFDPDDWCAREMFERLYSEAARTRSDIVIAGMRRYHPDEAKPVVARLSNEILSLPRPFSPQQAGNALFVAGRANPVSKIFRRAFVVDNGISFQAIPRVNDLYFSFVSLAKAERISVVEDVPYCYRMGRPGSLQTTLRSSGRPLCWLEAAEAVRARLEQDGALARFATPLLTAVLGMGVRAMSKLGSSEDIGLFYSELRRMAAGLATMEVRDALSARGRDVLALLEAESSPLPFLAAMNRDLLQTTAKLRAWKREAVRRAAAPLWRRALNRIFGRDPK